MYTFNSKLRIGDIILVRGNALHSKIIAKLTKGHYSHAMIALENGIFLEAITGSGVQKTSQLRISFEDKSNFIVLRCIFSNEKIATTTLSYLSENYLKYQGYKYNLSGAIFSLIPLGKNKLPKGYFCSHLVASMYKDAGISLLDKPVHKVTPNDLINSPNLEDITDQVTFEYSEIALNRVKKSGQTINLIDSGGTTLSTDAKNHQLFLKKIAKYFKRKGLKSPNRFGEIPEILTNPNNKNIAIFLDQKISKVYKEIGINEYLKNNTSNFDFESDTATLLSEIESYGYDHALSIYKNYNYLLIIGLIKQLNMTTSHDTFLLCYQKWGFEYFSLLVEYYSILIKSHDQILNHYLDIINIIEKNFSDKSEYLHQLKSLIIIQTIKEQKDPKNKEALIEFIKSFQETSY